MSGLEQAVEFFNGPAKMARALKVTPPTLTQWRGGARPIPLDRAMQIERLTNGAVTREELRPDVDWRTHADVASDTDPNEAAEPLEKAA